MPCYGEGRRARGCLLAKSIPEKGPFLGFLQGFIGHKGPLKGVLYGFLDGLRV